MRPHRSPLSAAVAVLVAPVFLATGAAAFAAPGESLPTSARSGDSVSSEIDPAGDVDEYGVFLAPGDALTVTVRDDGVVRGLQSTLSLSLPDGSAAAPLVKGAGTVRGRLSYKALDTGVHAIRVVGKPGEFTGSLGGYALTIRVRRARTPKGRFEDPEGGIVSHSFPATEGATMTLRASTRRGSFVLDDLLRPDGTSEPGFADALKAPATGRSARIKKLLLSGGDGVYRLEGSYQAGASVAVTVGVRHVSKPRKRPLGVEPAFDPIFLPFPARGIVGTVVVMPGTGFTFVDVPDEPGPPPVVVPDLYPRIWMGDIEVPRDSITRVNGIYRFEAPAGIVARATYPITVLNADGQSVRLPGAFTVAPTPNPTSIVAIDGGQAAAGPAGGRRLRILGSDLNYVIAVAFGSRIANPRPILADRVDVVAPPHLPGDVTVTVHDEFGQTASIAAPFPYLDVPSNVLESIDLPFLQAIGGETVVVSGSGFGDDSALSLDGEDVDATFVSPTELRFTAPTHEDATVELRVVDALEQTSAIPVTIEGFDDRSSTLVPEPVTTASSADGWRGTRMLVGDVDGDDRPDLVLLQPAQALGSSSARSRIRVLTGNSNGSFADATATAIPAVSGDEDWRAKDGALADLDGDGDLDLAVVTDEDVDSGERSSLRLLENDGSGGFADKTGEWAPAATEYGDRNQGVAIVAMDVDGENGTDLVIAHTDYFSDSVSEEVPGTGDPTADPPIPPDIVTTYFHYPALRVLLNDGNGALLRSDTAVPEVSDTDVQQYQADTLAVADLDADGLPDLLLSRGAPVEDSDGAFHRALRVLRNEGGTFSDVSDTWLPDASDPEYLQAARIVVSDVAGDSRPDVLLLSSVPLASPGGGGTSSGPSLRLLVNSSGALSPASSGTLPAKDGSDQLQGADVAVGDLDGDGLPELVVVASAAPDFGGRACRILRNTGSAWVRATLAMPSGTAGDDGRGAALGLIDLGDDGDPDLLVLRNDPDETARNLRIFVNPQQ